MDDPAKSHRPTSINKETLISFGLAIMIGAGCFTAGVLYNQIQTFHSIGAGERLARLEVITKLIAKQVGVPLDIIATGAAAKPSR